MMKNVAGRVDQPKVEAHEESWGELGRLGCAVDRLESLADRIRGMESGKKPGDAESCPCLSRFVSAAGERAGCEANRIEGIVSALREALYG